MSSRKKVYVGISGGVDSSVSALTLKKEGFDVTGVFIKIWHPDFLQCNWKAEMRDAMRICAKLEISFKMLDLSETYKKEVMDYMIEEYRSGRTPNPDVMCNKFVKFGGFFDYAMNDGADFVATGHYAQVKDGKMLKAVDQDKDQTYFLWTLKREHLLNTLFPIGNLKKEKVRKIAERNNLFTAEKKDSQGLCFVGHVDMKEFLKKYIETKKGNVLNSKGEVIGEHDGSVLYTIGERHGFLITKKDTDEKPLYVISKNIKDNTITVSDSKISNETSANQITVTSLNLNQENIEGELEARIRYRQPLQKVNLDAENKEVTFDKPQESISSGQSIVFYKNDECLGGAIIK